MLCTPARRPPCPVCACALQPRTPNRPSTPIPSRPSATSNSSPASYSAPASYATHAAPLAGSSAGLEDLAAWISTNFMGMGKSAADALPGGCECEVCCCCCLLLGGAGPVWPVQAVDKCLQE